MNITKTYKGNDVPKSTKWIYSSVATFRDACYTLVSMFLVTYIQFSGILTKGLDTSDPKKLTSTFVSMFAVITALVIGYRVFDALNDPFMGVIIEKVHFKTGKYKPWILIGSITNSITVIALFLAPSWFSWLSSWAYIGWFAAFYLLWGMTFTMNDIAYWGMLPSLTSDEKKRNAITTIMTIFCSVGQFAVAGLSPILSGKFGYSVYPNISIIVTVLFLISQIVLFLFLKEHERDVEEEKRHPAPKFKNMFSIMKKNDQVRIMVIVLFIYYLGSGILNTLGLNYFYFAINYSVGSSVMMYFTIIYGVGYLLAQSLFPLISKKLSKNRILFLCFIGVVVGYILFFIYSLPIGDNKYLGPSPLTSDGKLNIVYLILLCLIGLIIFFSQGLFYLVILIMMTNTIEYNEYVFYERKEAVIFSLRPLTTKLASALQQGILYLFLLMSSLYEVISNISNLQNQNALNEISSKELTDGCDILLSTLKPWQVIVFKLGVSILPLILFIVAYFIVKAKYKIDEKTYAEMVEEIAKRKENISNEEVNNQLDSNN